MLREAIEALDKRDKDVAAAERQKAPLLVRPGRLFGSKFQSTIGNPKASGYTGRILRLQLPTSAKAALPDVTKLMKDDPNLKLVLKDYPVLGPGSVEAAKVASAARNRIAGRQILASSNTKLLATHGPVGTKEALAVARDMGLDMDKLAKDMDSPDIKTGLDEVMQLADSLQITGTPTFVLGQDHVVVGAVEVTISSKTRSIPCISAGARPVEGDSGFQDLMSAPVRCTSL